MYIFALQFNIMKKVTQSLLIVLLFSFSVIHAHEGMWIPSLLKVLEGQMQSEGMKITAEDIYSINKSSLKSSSLKEYPFILILDFETSLSKKTSS